MWRSWPLSDGPPRDEEWVSIEEGATRLGMSPSWFKLVAKSEGISVKRRGRKPGARWKEVEALIARSSVQTSP